MIMKIFTVAGREEVEMLDGRVYFSTNNWTTVYVKWPSGRTERLTGKEADQAYQEATGDTGHVPNDHFVVNDNPLLRTLPLSPDFRLRLLDWNHCCETFFDGDLSLFAQAIEQQTDVADGDLIYRGQSQWWVTVENGVVTEIEEQYSP